MMEIDATSGKEATTLPKLTRENERSSSSNCGHCVFKQVSIRSARDRFVSLIRENVRREAGNFM